MKCLAGMLIITLLLSCGNGRLPVAESTDEKLAAAAAAVDLPLDEKIACLFSQIAYCRNPQEKLDSFLPGWKLAWYPGQINSNHAFVATNGRQWAIAFRGSLMEVSWHAFDNWINQDLNILTQVKWPHSAAGTARISQGMHNSFTNLSQLRDTINNKTLIEFIKTNIRKDAPILITGHSLGGSMATVYASYLYEQLNSAGNKIEIISFAAPAPGNEAFADDFDQKFPGAVRIESEGDIVARFPCTEKVTDFAKNCAPLPSADQINVSYQGIRVSLRKALEMCSLAMTLLELKNGSSFKQVAGTGRLIRIKPIETTNSLSVENWFSAAGYQHGIAQYAAALGIPLINCP